MDISKMMCRRTSTWGEKPCPEATQEKFISVDRRTVDHPSKFKCMSVEDWYREGKNHRVEDGMITRDLTLNLKRWVVKFNQPADFLDFIERYAPVVIDQNNDSLKPVFEIEIYDDYRE